MKPKFFTSLVFITFISLPCFATHNAAGNITYEQTGEMSIRATIHTFTVASSIAADRDTLFLCWGDGICEAIPRNDASLMGNDIKHNRYIREHQYASFGTYTLSMTDPNRNAGILNINSPFSENVPFHLQTLFVLNAEMNNSPDLLEAPIDIGYVGSPYVHNPNAFDAEGDSIAYEAIIPMQDIDTPVPDYLFPNEVVGNVGSSYNINETTGTITWDSPDLPGLYVVAILIKEYRNGQMISSTVRDMMFDISLGFTENDPPFIVVPNDLLETFPGQAIQFDVVFDDLDSRVIVTATGGPFEVNSPAIFNVSSESQATPVTLSFEWEITEEHVRDQVYQIVFTAIDDNMQEPQTSEFVVRIKVSGEPNFLFNKEKIEELKLFPNPSNGLVNFIIVDEVMARSDVSVFDSQGKLIRREKLTGGNVLDLRNEVAGVYYILLEQGKKKYGGKGFIER